MSAERSWIARNQEEVFSPNRSITTFSRNLLWIEADHETNQAISRTVGNPYLTDYERVARTWAQSLRAPMIGSKRRHFCMQATTRLFRRG
jgi:hypothetical protein